MTQTFKDRLREWEGVFDWINGRDLAADADQQLASKDAEIARLRGDAERYRLWRSEYTSADDDRSDLLIALANAWTPESVDAALDAELAARKKG